MASDTLSNMVRNLRSEIGSSLSIAQGQNQLTTLQYYLQRTQIELWTAFTWPDLKIRVNISTAAGQYVYPYTVDMGFDQIRQAWWAQANSSEWSEVGFGLNESMLKGDNTNSTSGDPVQFWDVEDTSHFRVWPTPASVGYVRFVGNKALAPFLLDTDSSTLDSTMITMFAGAELLARAKAQDAPAKLQKAQRHLLKTLGNKVSAKQKVSVLGGYAGKAKPTPYLDYIPTLN
jgi:hypothetical protein